jgi:group I intron endonuclease
MIWNDYPMTNIYKIENTINGEFYIGKTVKTLHKRFLRHKNAAKNGSPLKLHRAMRKHGVENFKISILAVVEDGSKAERQFIHDLNPTYNMTLGGDGGATVTGKRCITDGKIQKYISQEDKIPDGFRYGVSDSTSYKNSLPTKARKYRGPMSEETKQKMSASAKARWSTNLKHKPTKQKKDRSKPCTIDGITIFKSKKDLEKCLGRSKFGSASPSFRYV